MTNYKKAFIYLIVVVISLVSGMLFGHGIIPSGILTVISGMGTGLILGIIGRAYFWGDNS